MFRLRANPIRNERPDGGRGHRVPLLRVEQQVEWLTRRSAGHGFDVVAGEHGPNVRVTERRTERFRRGGLDGRLVTLGLRRTRAFSK